MVPLTQAEILPTIVVGGPHAPAEALPQPRAAVAAAARIEWPRLAQGLGAAGIFGFAWRTATVSAIPDLGHAAWALALPASLLLAWVLCLPAFYVFHASGSPEVGLKQCVAAGIRALAATGAGLASTAPILWFFAASAPESRITGPLSELFVGLALLAGVVTFGQAIRSSGAALRLRAQWGLAGLVALTFLQLAQATGLRWS